MEKKRKNRLSEEYVKSVVKNCYSIADFCRAVGWLPIGGNYRVFHKYEKEYNLDTSHFTGLKTNLNNKNNKKYELSAKEYAKNLLIKSKVLIKKLIEEGIKERKCECCGNTEWMGGEIPLEIHHIDGNCFNNDFNNLQILCPNCHAKTDTYRGKNIKRKNKIFRCKDCGRKITKYSKTGLCIQCVHKRQTNKPDKETLMELIKDHSFVDVGKMFDVSDVTIRHWCQKYDIIK